MIARQDMKEGEHPHVLLAEDDAQTRGIICEALCALGCRVTECGNGMEFFKQLSPLLPPRGPFDPDLIVVDPAMSGAGWLEVVAAVTADEDLPPLVLIGNGHGRENDLDSRRLSVAAQIDDPREAETVCRIARTASGERRHPSLEQRDESCW